MLREISDEQNKKRQNAVLTVEGPEGEGLHQVGAREITNRPCATKVILPQTSSTLSESEDVKRKRNADAAGYSTHVAKLACERCGVEGRKRGEK